MKTEARIVKTLRVLTATTEPLSARAIAEKYMESPTSSDALATGTICNILAVVGILERIESFKGKSIRVAYKYIGE